MNRLRSVPVARLFHIRMAPAGACWALAGIRGWLAILVLGAAAVVAADGQQAALAAEAQEAPRPAEPHQAARAAEAKETLPASLARFQAAQAMIAQGDLSGARKEYEAVLRMADVPEHHRREAQERLAALEEQGPSDLPEPKLSPPTEVPDVKPAVVLYVSPQGADDNPGTAERPFATLQRARDEIRQIKQRRALPAGGVAVQIAPGHYLVRETLVLGAEDSGAAEAPIVYRAAGAERPVFSGGIRLEKFEPVVDAQLLARLPAEARGKVVQMDLHQQGLREVLPLVLGGFASGRGFRTHPVMELFFDGRALPLAGWPNEGFVQVARVSDEQPNEIHGRRGSKLGVIYFEDQRLARWAEEPEAWFYGYWFWDWADSYEKVRRIQPAKHKIEFEPPYHRYGYRAGQPFRALNLFCEIDLPGEWYLDRQRAVLYLYPPSDPQQAVVELSAFERPFVELNEVAHVRFERIVWELGCADGVKITGGSDCLLAGCTVRCCAGDGVVISGGRGHGLLSCDIHSLGRGGAVVSGGERKTLQPARHFVENCHIFDLSRIDHTYTPAVLLSGVGNRLAHNLVHDIGSSAFRVGGNDHLIELNEVFRVVTESDDQGAVDMYGDPTFAGVVYRYNYFHHIGGWQRPTEEPALGRAGVRLDDAISGVLVYGNVFYRASSGRFGFGGVQIHGGKDNIVDNNLFIDCRAAVSFSPWGEARWQQFVAGALDRSQIDKELYLRRYPYLGRLSEDHDRNWVYRNLAWHCGTLLHRNSRFSVAGQNLVTEDNPGIEEPSPGTFRLRPDAAFWGQLGFCPIPFDQIGLYRDRFRHQLPEQCIATIATDDFVRWGCWKANSAKPSMAAARTSNGDSGG